MCVGCKDMLEKRAAAEEEGGGRLRTPLKAPS